MNFLASGTPIVLSGGEAACCLGDDLAQIRAGNGGLRPLGELGLPNEFSAQFAGWIQSREKLQNRRYAPASALAVDLAQKAVSQRGWSRAEIESACVFAGSSRGNLAGWLEPWPGRTPRRLYAASNNLHSEIATAVSIELGVRGATQTLASGCSAGLDALGMAALWLRNGLAQRAIVVSVDLPLITPLLRVFRDSGLLSAKSACDPYSPDTDGFHPAEAGVAILLETAAENTPEWCRVAGYWVSSDAYDSIGTAPDGAGMLRCLQTVRADLRGHEIAALCPHANGTPAQMRAESAALAAWSEKPTLHLTKPRCGHSLGASGALETLLLADSMRQGLLPANSPALTAPAPGFELPVEPREIQSGHIALNMSVGMGGHNAVLALQAT